MSRPSTRRTMTLESLEKREVLSATTLASKQYILELVNMARTNPAGAAQWISNHVDDQTNDTLNYYKVNLQQELADIASSPVKPPLAYNDQLDSAAQGQSQDQASNNFQGHNGSDGSDLNVRLGRVGYGDVLSNAENAFAYATSLDNSIDAFLIDWGVADKGHRRNILQGDVDANDSHSDVGIGIVETAPTNRPNAVGPFIVTIDFGKQKDSKPQLLGVAFNDLNKDGYYNQGEGQGNLVVKAKNLANGKVTSTQTTGAGGYQVELDPGNYTVTGWLNGQLVRTESINVGSVNVKVDFKIAPKPPGGPKASTSNAVVPVAAPVAAPKPIEKAQVAAPKPIEKAQVAAPEVVPVLALTNPTPTPINATVAPTVNPALKDPLSWITSWTAYRGGRRIN